MSKRAYTSKNARRRHAAIRNQDIVASASSQAAHNNMAEDPSSTPAANSDNDSSNAAIPFPTLTIIYMPAEAAAVIDEVTQKYSNITVEDCAGYFHGSKRQYRKITIWSQGIDSLWLNAVIARTKELAAVEFVTVVSGGMMHVL